MRYDFQKNMQKEIQTDIQHAIKLGCKFKVITEDSKAPKNCDDAGLLREFLKQDFEEKAKSSINSNKKANENNKEQQDTTLHLNAVLEFINNENSYTTTLVKKKTNIDSIESKNKEKIQINFNVANNKMKESFDIPFHPNIVFYTEQSLKDSDLESKRDELQKSKFFTTLFKILDVDIETIQTELKEGAANKRKSREKDIEEKCDKINKRFNKLYCLNNDNYKFSVRLEENTIAFCMEKNNEAICLNQQSTGFKKFFNLFFNFLYDDTIKKGDIILIDEADAHLSIPAQKELRSFLKEFGKESGILFIIATHSPYMVDVRHLDEIRIVKALNSLESKDCETKGSLFINDFSMLGYGKIDVLNDLRNALGASIELDSNMIVFVEGIMDYNILNAYSEIYEYPNDSKKLIFLPISGLGGKDCDTESNDKNNNSKSKEPYFSDEQKEKAQNLLDFSKQIKVSNPILLVDSDKSGKAMKKGVEEDFELQNLSIIELESAFMEGEIPKKNFKGLKFSGIEFLFSKEDRIKFHFESCKENKQASIVSSIFKNTKNLKDKLSQESKINFNELFKYLIELKNR